MKYGAGPATGFVLGAMVGWANRPAGWTLSWIETLQANLADHAVEYDAERINLMVLSAGRLGACAGGLLLVVGPRLVRGIAQG